MNELVSDPNEAHFFWVVEDVEVLQKVFGTAAQSHSPVSEEEPVEKPNVPAIFQDGASVLRRESNSSSDAHSRM